MRSLGCAATFLRRFQSSPVPEDGCNPPRSRLRAGFFSFQSSPVPEDGCNDKKRVVLEPIPEVSILTRPGGRVQLAANFPPPTEDSVSILTRPGGRVQRVLNCEKIVVVSVSILTRPGGRVQRGVKEEVTKVWLFQSSPVPEDGCNQVPCTQLVCVPRVSILTRPGGRVQPVRTRAHGALVYRFNPHPSRRTGATLAGAHAEALLQSFNPHPSRRTGATMCGVVISHLHLVSILTRPGGRVQRGEIEMLVERLQCFNPHPSRRTGATIRGDRVSRDGMFQSSPVPEDGCNYKPQRTRCVRAGFNPHPSRRTGATWSEPPKARCPECFNPHPSRRTGATFPMLWRLSGTFVSILTRPGGRVQPTDVRVVVAGSNGFNPHPSRRTGATGGYRNATHQRRRFNPHPSRRTGATGSLWCLPVPAGFQSSPVPEDGCNKTRFSPRAVDSRFQSSPVPEDGCNAVQPH